MKQLLNALNLNRKKTGLIILLAVLIIGFAWPKPALGFCVGDTDFGFFGTGIKSPTGCVVDVFGDIGIQVVQALANLLLLLGKEAFLVASSFLLYVLGPEFTAKTLGDPVFFQMWSNVRDLTNMLIVLGFVFVGIATTLRIQEYGAKKILPYLIGIAILINFSGLIANEMYNTANIVQNAFLKNGGGGAISLFVQNIDSTIADKRAEAEKDVKNNAKSLAVLAASAFALVIYLFSAFVFLILAILLAARYGILVVLYILSPLAMFCFIFAPTKKWWTMWWENMLKWNLIGVVSGFLIYLSASTIAQEGSNFFVSLIFLYLAYKFSQGSSAVGASAALGLASGAAGFAMGYVGAGKIAGKIGLGGKGADAGSAVGGVAGGEALANSRLGQKAQRGALRAGEALRLVTPGTANLKQQEQLKADKVEDKIKTLDDDQLVSRATGRAFMTGGRNAKVAAIKHMAEKGKFGKIKDPAARREAMQYGIEHGIDEKEFTKGDPDLAINSTMTALQRHTAMAGVIGKQGPKEVAKNLKDYELTPESLGVMTDKQLQQYVNNASPQSVASLRTLTRSKAGKADLQKHIAALIKEGADSRTIANAANSYKNAAKLTK